MLLNYHIGRIVLGWQCVGVRDTTLDEPHHNSNTQQSKKNTANVVFQQHSRKLLKMDILTPVTC